MLVQYLIAFHLFFAMVFGAPLLTTISKDIPLPTTATPVVTEKTAFRLNISLPESFKYTINYETIGKFSHTSIMFLLLSFD
jgi:hypothetical protein